MSRANHTVLDTLDSEAFRSFESHVPGLRIIDPGCLDSIIDGSSSGVSIRHEGILSPIVFPSDPAMAELEKYLSVAVTPIE